MAYLGEMGWWEGGQPPVSVVLGAMQSHEHSRGLVFTQHTGSCLWRHLSPMPSWVSGTGRPP